MFKKRKMKRNIAAYFQGQEGISVKDIKKDWEDI